MWLLLTTLSSLYIDQELSFISYFKQVWDRPTSFSLRNTYKTLWHRIMSRRGKAWKEVSKNSPVGLISRCVGPDKKCTVRRHRLTFIDWFLCAGSCQKQEDMKILTLEALNKCVPSHLKGHQGPCRTTWSLCHHARILVVTTVFKGRLGARSLQSSWPSPVKPTPSLSSGGGIILPPTLSAHIPPRCCLHIFLWPHNFPWLGVLDLNYLSLISPLNVDI